MGRASAAVDQKLQQSLPDRDDSEDYDPRRLADAAAALRCLDAPDNRAAVSGARLEGVLAIPDTPWESPLIL